MTPSELTNVEDAIRILRVHRTMAISTIRPDGWPQTTVVGFANEGLTIYFLIFRSSQKFANIQHDGRISIAVAEEPRDLHDVRAVYAGANAAEVTDPIERNLAWRLLGERHTNLRHFVPPAKGDAATMRAECKHLSILDYSKGLGHTETVTIESDKAPRPANFSSTRKPQHHATR